MKISKYWARESSSAEDSTGYKYHLVSWSGSNQSVAAAKQKATAKLDRWKTLLREGHSLGDYPYEERNEIKEELIEEHYDDGHLIAAVTRNRYGALVLNSAHVLFADIDLPAQPNQGSTLLNKLLSLFRKRKNNTDSSEEQRAACRQRFIEFYNQHPDLSLRIYETYAGFRLAILNRLFDPLSEDTHALLKQLNSDKLYIRLCRSQECFRARLTPKPWRCGFEKPPNLYPREEADQQRKYSEWLQTYDSRSKDYGVCRLIEELGHAETVKTAQAVLQLHDKYVLNSNSQNLA